MKRLLSMTPSEMINLSKKELTLKQLRGSHRNAK